MPSVASVIALLRGINLGARNRVPMGGLRELLTDLGYPDSRTLLQSGNVVVETRDDPEKVARAIEKGVADRFGVQADVMVRTGRELEAVVKADPLGDVANDPKKYMVAFLAEKPKAPVIRELSSRDFGDEAFAAKGREVYMWCANGLRESKVAGACSEKNLGVRATVRNWNTVLKLHELL